MGSLTDRSIYIIYNIWTEAFLVRQPGMGRRPKSMGLKILESWPCAVGWEFSSRPIWSINPKDPGVGLVPLAGSLASPEWAKFEAQRLWGICNW